MSATLLSAAGGDVAVLSNVVSAPVGGVGDDSLAFTGAGATTTLLALVGLGSLAIGGLSMLTGRKINRRTHAHDPLLPDLTHLRATQMASAA